VIAGAAVWAGGKYVFDLQAPYVWALLSALAAYVGVALLEQRGALPAWTSARQE
jgi:hypothetical protein